MYTLEQLEQKTLKELKKIGWQLSVLPSADRRCRQNWIDALVGVNPPLLELLEVSPEAQVEPVYEAIEIQRQEPIAPEAKTSPGVSCKTSTAHQLLELFKSSAHIIQDSPAGALSQKRSKKRSARRPKISSMPKSI